MVIDDKSVNSLYAGSQNLQKKSGAQLAKMPATKERNSLRVGDRFTFPAKTKFVVYTEDKTFGNETHEVSSIPAILQRGTAEKIVKFFVSTLANKGYNVYWQGSVDDAKTFKAELKQAQPIEGYSTANVGSAVEKWHECVTFEDVKNIFAGQTIEVKEISHYVAGKFDNDSPRPIYRIDLSE